jgi:membrane fusion protein (multidrug efflux system)
MNPPPVVSDVAGPRTESAEPGSRPSEEASPPGSPAAPAGRRWVPRWTTVAGWAFAILGLAVGIGMIGQFVFYRFTRSMTDDAFVESHIVNLSPQVGGLITRVHVEEHDHIQAGQLLTQIDPAPHQRELDLARAKREVAEATLKLEEATLERLVQEHPRKVALAEKDQAVAESALEQARTQLRLTTHDVEEEIRQAKAAVDSYRAVLTKAREDYDRYKKLFEERSAPERKFQDVTRDYRTAEADLEAAMSRLSKAEKDRLQIEIAASLVAQKERARERAEESVRLAILGELLIAEQRRTVEQRRVQVAEARRGEETVLTNLEYTRVIAPFDGVVVRRFRNPGDHAPVGSPILSVYDPELVYVTAYMEEERLEGVSPGNAVKVWLDAVSEPLTGRVVWIERATGANFALLPRDVSSGEFTRVTQRVPIRIALDRGKHWDELRPGLSATVSIAHGPGDPAWAAHEAEWQRARGAMGLSPIQPTAAEAPVPSPKP